MGAILVLTPMVVASWPALSAAVMGAAASMGYAVGAANAAAAPKVSKKKSVETEIENSEVLSEAINRGLKIGLQKDGVNIEFGQDERGACTVCVTGEGHSQKQLKQIGEEVAGRVVQQFAYHKLMTELKKRNYSIVSEEVMQDEAIQVRVRL